jgi:hypothetical protein
VGLASAYPEIPVQAAPPPSRRCAAAWCAAGPSSVPAPPIAGSTITSDSSAAPRAPANVFRSGATVWPRGRMDVHAASGVPTSRCAGLMQVNEYQRLTATRCCTRWCTLGSTSRARTPNTRASCGAIRLYACILRSPALALISVRSKVTKLNGKSVRVQEGDMSRSGHRGLTEVVRHRPWPALKLRCFQ